MLHALDHVTLRSADLDRTAAFYRSILGLAPGPRPAFPVPGLWLYASGRPRIHVVGSSATRPPGTIDHVAFGARGRATLERRLAVAGVAYRVATLPDGSALQLFVQDPDGATLEFVFRSNEDSRP